jgi:hypothetical protein
VVRIVTAFPGRSEGSTQDYARPCRKSDQRKRRRETLERDTGEGHRRGTPERDTGEGHWRGTRERDTGEGHRGGTPGRNTGEVHGRGTAERDTGEGHRRGTAERDTGEGHRRGTPERDTGEGHERVPGSHGCHSERSDRRSRSRRIYFDSRDLPEAKKIPRLRARWALRSG